MQPIQIVKLNETWMKILCPEKYQELDIQDKFSFEVENAQYDIRVRKHHWDGIIRLYNLKTKRMYVGLLPQLLEFFDSKNWPFTLDDDLMPSFEDDLSLEDVESFVTDLEPKAKDGSILTPHDYQLNAIHHAITTDRSVILSATSSGKSFMIYCLVRMYQLLEDVRGKTICITVPSINLVNQLYADFEEYSRGTSWSPNRFVQKITGNHSKTINKPIVITTWQSQLKLSYYDLSSIAVAIMDECHTCKASSLTKILESLTNCKYRHGFTGTLDDIEHNELTIQGLLGTKIQIVSAKELMDANQASNLKVSMVLVNHSQETKKEFVAFKRQYAKQKFYSKKKYYDAEIEFLMSHQSRLDFLLDIIESTDGNSLILFDRVDVYGEQLYNIFKERRPDSTFLIVGKVDGDEREEIRLDIDKYDDATVWASYGVMSTGVSINKLHNCFLISSSKSKIRVLQSLGRMMRLHSTKTHANVYDIVDKLDDTTDNYMMIHAQKRLEYYMKEQFDINFIDIDM